MPYDAHDTPVLQFDSESRLHVICSAHRSRPTYLRSEKGEDISSLRERKEELPEEMSDASYPCLVRLAGSGKLWLIYRLGSPHRSQWRATAWDAEAGKWGERPHTIITGISGGAWPAGPYLNQPIMFADDRVGFVTCWRSTAVQGGSRDPMNIGLDYFEYCDDFTMARTGAGIVLSMPISSSNSERVIAVPWGADLVNQTGACALDNQTPCFVGTWREPGAVRQIHFCWRVSDGSWKHRPVTSIENDSFLVGQGTLPMPFSRPVVVPCAKKRAIVLYRTSNNGGQLLAQPLSPPHYDPRHHQARVLVDGALDQYEPVVERLGVITSGWLHVFVQAAQQQVGGDLMDIHASAPASLQSWRVERFFSGVA